MKKLFYFISFMMIVIMNTSCEKSTDSTTVKAPTEITKPSDLEGTWEFQNFYVAENNNHTGGNYTTCPAPYEKVLISLKFTGSTCTVSDKCSNPTIIAQNYEVRLYGDINKQIILASPTGINNFSFMIKSCKDGILILIRSFSTGISSWPITTELTLKKIK